MGRGVPSEVIVERPDLQPRLRDVPHRPGVYVMRDRFRRIIYVGKAKDLRKRLASYFTPSRRAGADIKTRALIDSIWEFEIHVVKSEAEAVLYEGRLIKDFRPKYNVSFRDDKRFLLVRVDKAEAWPRFQPTRLKREDGAHYYGPFADGGALRAALAAMAKTYGIRTCRAGEPSEKDFRHCLDHVIRNCSTPCMGRVTREEYMRQVEEACAFLDGESEQMVEQVEIAMKAAAEKLDFEKAVELRNLLEDLRATARPMTRFTHKSLPSAINPQEDVIALAEALHLASPPVVMECFDIANISDTHIVASMVRFRDGSPDRANYRRYRITGTRTQNDFASMEEVVRRRYSRLSREAAEAQDGEVSQEPLGEVIERLRCEGRAVFPDLIIVDGGRGQLSSACSALQKLGLPDIPIIGLAKEFEEIHRVNHPLPLRLSKDSGALKLLQRIRDEAHRFANGYHSILLKRRMKESLLDAVLGLSEARKKALLAKFGSVERIGKQSVETLATLPGISKKMAHAVLAAATRT